MKQYFTQIKDSKQKYIIFLLVTALFLVTRCVYLDRDLPPTGISSHVAIDEMYYTITAFNLYHYGETIFNPVPATDLPSAEDTQPNNILENCLTYLTLIIFGNNYYGVRMAAVLAALISFIFFYLVILGMERTGRQVNDPCRTDNRNYINYFIIFYLLFDFSFMMAGRVAEPTIFRLMALSIIVYIGSLPRISSALTNNWYSLLLGFLSMAAVVYVYVYNAFVLIAMAATIVIWAKKDGLANSLRQMAWFGLGALICLASYMWYIDAYYHTTLIGVYQSMLPYRNRIGVGLTLIDSFKALLINVLYIFTTNIFRFNISLLFAFLVSLPIFIRKLKAEKSNFDIMVFNLLLFLFLQSVIINDWPLRKLVIMLPIALLIIAISFQYSKRNDVYIGRYLRLYWFTCLLVSLAIWAIFLFTHINGEYYSEIKNALYLNLIVFLIVATAMTLTFVRGKDLSKSIIAICAIVMLLPNIYLDNRYVLSEPTYYYRDAMIKMGEKINGTITAGGASYGFRLYNTSIPVLNIYAYTKTRETDIFDRNFDYLFDNDIAKYSIDYIDDQGASSYVREHGLELVEEYDTGKHVSQHIGLYAKP